MIDNLKFDRDGLIPVITQDINTKEVLMLAYMNEEAYKKTIETGNVHYFSRSRMKLWLKGETSGHFQIVKNIKYDCDCDSLLIFVEQVGAACHTGNKSCFYRDVNGLNENSTSDMCANLTTNTNKDILPKLYEVIKDRVVNPKAGSYTNYLFEKGIDKMLKKVGEETTEVVIAAKNNDKSEITYEIADLCYHLSVVMVETGVTWQDIYSELEKREEKQ